MHFVGDPPAFLLLSQEHLLLVESGIGQARLVVSGLRHRSDEGTNAGGGER
jgi:hypothetical protein